MACGSSPPPPATNLSPGLNVAVVDGEATARRSDEQSTPAVRDNFLLNTLAARCSIAPARVGDLAVSAKQALHDHYGRDVKARIILEGVNSGSSRSTDCASLFDRYIALVGP